MAFYSRQSITGIAGTSTYTYTVPILDPTHLNVSIDGVAATNLVVNTSASTITFDDVLAGGEVILVWRRSGESLADQLVDPTDAAVLSEDALDTLQRQLLYLVQELMDAFWSDLGSGGTAGSLFTALNAVDPPVRIPTTGAADGWLLTLGGSPLVPGWEAPPSGTGGEANTGLSLGAGEGDVYKETLGAPGVLQFRSLLAGGNITITQDANEITIAGAAPTGEANTASNSTGGGVGVFSQKTGVDLELRNISPATDVVTVALDAVNALVEVGLNQDQMRAATGGQAGFMSAANFTKLAGIEALADVTDATNVNAAGAVMESDFNAQSVLVAVSDDAPVALVVGEQTVVGRLTGGDVGARSVGDLRTLLDQRDVHSFNLDAPATGQQGAAVWINEASTIRLATHGLNNAVAGDVDWNLRFGADLNGAGTGVFAADKTTTAGTGTEETVFASASIPANNWLWVKYGTVTTSPDGHHITVETTRD